MEVEESVHIHDEYFDTSKVQGIFVYLMLNEPYVITKAYW